MFNPLESLDIHIVHQEQLKSLQELLASLQVSFAYAKRPESNWLRVWVYDNASSPQTVQRWERYFEKEKALWHESLCFYRSPVPHVWGYCHAELITLSQPKGFVMFLTPTCTVPPDFFPSLCQNALTLSLEKPRYFLPVLRRGKKSFSGASWYHKRTGLKPRSLRSSWARWSRKKDPSPSAWVPGLMVPAPLFMRVGSWKKVFGMTGTLIEMAHRIEGQNWLPTHLSDTQIHLKKNSDTFSLQKYTSELQERLELVERIHLHSTSQRLARWSLGAEALGQLFWLFFIQCDFTASRKLWEWLFSEVRQFL